MALTSVQMPVLKVTEAHGTDTRWLLLTLKLIKALNPYLNH